MAVVTLGRIATSTSLNMLLIPVGPARSRP